MTTAVAPSGIAPLRVRYREAVRAWFIASRIVNGSRPAERLEERVLGFEDAAASIEMPALWYFLESARLIRAGDLTGAKRAFDTGVEEAGPGAAAAAATAEVAVGSAPFDNADALSSRFRDALRARYVADHGSSAARLDERVRNLEEAAAAMEMPARWYYLESARLIRGGDLVGAQAAFDAAIVPQIAASAAATPVDAPLVDAPSTVYVLAGIRALQWDRIALVGYLVLIVIAELAVTFFSPLLVFPFHGGIVVLAAMHLAWIEGHTDRESGIERLRPFLLTVIVVASIRLISLTLPLTSIEPAYRFLLAGIPMTLGALLVVRAVPYSIRDVGLVWRKWPMQVAVIAVSVGLGFVEYAILQPAPLGPLPWTLGGLLPALVVGIATGFPEELIFRGVLQTATRPIVGRFNWIYASLVFAALHIGYGSPSDLMFVFGVGLLYGWVFERSRSIIGTSIGHGLANVVLFFVAPNLPAVAGLLGS